MLFVFRTINVVVVDFDVVVVVDNKLRSSVSWVKNSPTLVLVDVDDFWKSIVVLSGSMLLGDGSGLRFSFLNLNSMFAIISSVEFVSRPCKKI